LSVVKAIIGEEFVESGQRLQVKEPATGNVLGEIPNLSLDQVKRAIDVAHDSLQKLQSLTIAARSSLLHKVAEMIRADPEPLATLMSREIGRPLKSSRGEIQRTAQIFDLASTDVRDVFAGGFVPLESYDFPPGNDKRLALLTREPVGVVAAITPFNFPSSSLAHKVAPALAVGNTVVHKPSVFAPLTQLKLGEMILKAGFPPGSINIVTGNSTMIGNEFVENPKVSLITFTGSEKVGLDLASRATRHGKRAIMELGGSDAQIVLEDANLEKAADAALIGRFDYAGQFCNSTKRLLVRKEVAEKFTALVKERLAKTQVGDPMSLDTTVGPLISQDAVASMKGFVEDAEKKGGRVIYQGTAPQNGGYYFPPTLISMEGTRAKMLSEEVFGPVVPMLQISSDDEAVEIANSTEYGLDASIFTKDFSRAYRLAGKIKVGTVMINDTTRLRWDNLPFGGPKKSGIGRESVKDSMIEMTESKVIEYKLD
jgi:succinyl-CoA reductase